jgi:hypothetical protein
MQTASRTLVVATLCTAFLGSVLAITESGANRGHPNRGHETFSSPA